MCMYLDKIYVSDCWTIKHSHVEFLPSPFYNFFWCKIDCKRKHLKFQQIVCIPVCKFSCIKLCTSLIFLLNVFYQVYTGICRYKYFWQNSKFKKLMLVLFLPVKSIVYIFICQISWPRRSQTCFVWSHCYMTYRYMLYNRTAKRFFF